MNNRTCSADEPQADVAGGHDQPGSVPMPKMNMPSGLMIAARQNSSTGQEQRLEKQHVQQGQLGTETKVETAAAAERAAYTKIKSKIKRQKQSTQHGKEVKVSKQEAKAVRAAQHIEVLSTNAEHAQRAEERCSTKTQQRAGLSLNTVRLQDQKAYEV